MHMHAGAIIESGSGSAVDKIKKLQEVGVRVALHPEEISDLLE
jgi:succinyl-CoA synthetase alpha subunit